MKKNSGPKKDSKRDERREYMRSLFSTTEEKADEKMALGKYEDAIRIIEKNIARLKRTDYEELPSRAATFYKLLSHAHLKAAFSHMQPLLESKKKDVELMERSGDLALESLAISTLAGAYAFAGEMKLAEETHKRAIAVAETAPVEKGNDDSFDRNDAVFHAKEGLMEFYLQARRIGEAKEIGKELQLMIKNNPSLGLFKDDVKSLLDAADEIVREE